MTETPHVWAVGDVTETHHLVTGLPAYIALATVANKQGRIAGMNLSGASIAFAGVLGTATTRVGTTEVARTGLTLAEATAAGMNALETRIQADTKLGYFADVSPMTVKLVAEIPTGRILGGQIVGGSSSGKQIDTIATAVTAHMTVTQVVHLDLAYAPAFSDVWDPVQIAARTLISKLQWPHSSSYAMTGRHLNRARDPYDTYLKSTKLEREKKIVEKIPKIPVTPMALNLWYEGPAFVVADKPRGMAVHPEATDGIDTLVNGLLQSNRWLADMETSHSPGVIHWLMPMDRGLVLVAKSDEVADTLRQLYRDQAITFSYRVRMPREATPIL